MKRLLNDPVMNNTGWPDHNKKVKRETDLQSDNKGTCSMWHPSCHRHRIPEGLTSIALLWLLYSRWPYLQESGRMFSSWSLLDLPRLSNKCVTNQFRTALTRGLKELSQSLVTSIINPTKREWLRCTRLLFLWCALSPQRLLPFSWWISSLHGLAEPPKMLRFTWSLGSHSNWIAWTPSVGIKRV